MRFQLGLAAPLDEEEGLADARTKDETWWHEITGTNAEDGEVQLGLDELLAACRKQRSLQMARRSEESANAMESAVNVFLGAQSTWQLNPPPPPTQNTGKHIASMSGDV